MSLLLGSAPVVDRKETIEVAKLNKSSIVRRYGLESRLGYWRCMGNIGIILTNSSAGRVR